VHAAIRVDLVGHVERCGNLILRGLHFHPKRGIVVLVAPLRVWRRLNAVVIIIVVVIVIVVIIIVIFVVVMVFRVELVLYVEVSLALFLFLLFRELFLLVVFIEVQAAQQVLQIL